eukprot:TRINITY_DN21172_c0_g1_i1.p1 TRINITY_DN21172_c0_g1~~TRINITY_DN21172_c0_g1_i1.p1  ORF type:complete len:626 (-),score=149.99 TRINITY_DN21172_c0_g1_i1:161-1972(-)
MASSDGKLTVPSPGSSYPAQPVGPSSGGESWRDWSGRAKGSEGYQLGDVSRGLMMQLAGRSSSHSKNNRSSRSPAGSTVTVNTFMSDTSRGHSPSRENSTEALTRHRTRDWLRSLFASAPRRGEEGSEERRKADADDAKMEDDLSSALQALVALQKACHKLEGLQLPLGGEDALQSVRQGVGELEARVNEAVEWRQRCPDGGRLLKVQVCSASGEEDPPEWAMGRLFLSADALLFESNETPVWRLGPFAWKDISKVEQFSASSSSSAGAVELAVTTRASGARYLLSGNVDTELLVKHYGRVEQVAKTLDMAEEKQGGKIDTKKSLAMTTVQSEVFHDALEEWLDGGWDSFRPQEEAEAMGALPSVAHKAKSGEKESDKKQAAASASPPKPAHSTVPTTKTFFAATEQLPAIDTLGGGEPVYSEHLPEVSLQEVRKAFLSDEEDWPIEVFLRKDAKAFNFAPTPWTQSQKTPGTSVRRVRFRLPIPDDIPDIAKKLISFPDDTAVTSNLRFGASEDKAVLVQEVCTHDVTFGDYFVVRDVMVFRPHRSGTGVTFDKITTVRWVQSLPWYARPLSSIIEMKTQTQSKDSGKCMAKVLRKGVGVAS